MYFLHCLFVQVPGLNPLGFHPELLADRLLPKLSTITQPFSDADKKEDIIQEDEDEEEDEMEEEGEDNEEDDADDMDGRENDEEMVDDEEEEGAT